MLNALFYFFVFLVSLSFLATILNYNSVISLLFLILSFFNISIILLLLESEFLALFILIIYIGAIAVLFIFVLMMLESKFTNLNKEFSMYFPFGIFINIIFFFELIIHISNNFFKNPHIINNYNMLYNVYCSWYGNLDSLSDIAVIGYVLYNHYILQFLIVGFILLLGLIGVVYLNNTFINKLKNKHQSVFFQISRNFTIF